MEPKLKAKELVHEFETTIFANFTHTKKSFAKQCALIAVEEILNAIYNEDFDGHLIDEHNAASYWQKVKEEIEKI